MLIFCDFDGTLCTTDVVYDLIDKFGAKDWRKDLLPSYRNGDITAFHILKETFKDIRVGQSELISFGNEITHHRDGLQQFLQFIQLRNWEFSILSSGLDTYIEPLAPNIKYICFEGTFCYDNGKRDKRGDDKNNGNGYWDVQLPSSPELKIDPRIDFKKQVLSQLKIKKKELKTVMIGDGRNDFEAAKEADMVFAVKGSTLHQMLQSRNIPHVEFTTFHEILDVIKSQIS